MHTALGRGLPRGRRSSSSSRPPAPSRCATSCASRGPGSYYFSAGGGLGFGLAASVGVQLAQPDRPVVCVLGEGSVQYAVTAFWSAVAYKVPVTFLVLQQRASTRSSSGSPRSSRSSGAPGLDLPELDVAAVAAGYGVSAHRVERPRRGARRARRGARLLAARSWSKSRSQPGMSLF